MLMNENKREETAFITIYTVKDWREWLAKNHLTEKKVGMVSYKKHTGKPSISHREAMHEAICFGWIDTTLKKLDEERFVRYFVRRGEKANWSFNTLRYAKELLHLGKMAPAGIERYREGLKKRPHDYGLPQKPEMPSELKKELVKNKKAFDNFNSFSPSVKNSIYRWILRAKREETRKKRVDNAVENALNNKREI